MTNEDIVKKFFSCYQAHDYVGMQNCLDENVKFADFAFDIEGKQVKAMWHWFCVSYPPRDKPVSVPEFEVVNSNNDKVLAKYRVNYLYGDNQRPVDYFIQAHFKLQDDKIVEQKDEFSSISEFEFAEMAFGFPLQLLALTPLLRVLVKKKAAEKLSQFIKDYGY
jgi:ketosteroid isomerase-like protein